jgi:hypothetical protein
LVQRRLSAGVFGRDAEADNAVCLAGRKMKDHPSGRPLRQPRRGIPQQIVWPRTECVVPRLNHQREQLAGGFGFGVPAEPEDSMWHETRAKKR